MFWDAHTVMAVPRHQPGPAGEGCSGLYRCLPPLVPGVSGQPHPPHSGHPKLCREDPLRVGSLQSGGRAGIGSGSTRCHKLEVRDREEPSRECWGGGAGWAELLSHPHLQRQGECCLEASTGGGCLGSRLPGRACPCSLISSAPSLSVVLSAHFPGLLSHSSSWSTAGSCCRH